MTKEEELFKAAEDGNINKVKSLLNPKLLGIIKPVDVNITREDGWTLLMAAACKGHRDVVNLLMEKGASVNAKTDDCFTPLMAAAKYGFKEIAELFLDHGADIHAAKIGEDAGETALMFAAWQGHKDIAELLIRRGSDVNAKTPTGYTAMMSAAKFGKPDIARLLFEHGADIHAVKTGEDPGWNAILFASWQGHTEVVKWLIDKGADVNSRTANQWTPLLYAARDGHKEVVKLLLDGGADIDAAQEDGWTPLILAAFNGCHEIIRLLLDRGADIHVIGEDQLNALETAIEKDFGDIAVTLIERGSDVARIRADGSSLLHKAIDKGMAKVVSAILKTGKVDVNLKDNKGRTALDLAGDGKRSKAAALLKQAGARYGTTTAPTGQETGEQEGLPRISAAVTDIYLVDSSTIRPTGAGGSFFQEAIQCHNNRDDNGAARNFQEALDAGLDKLRQGYAHANLGVLQLKKNEAAAAISHFMKVFALKEVLYESAHDAAQYMAVIYSELGRPEEAARLEQVAYQTRARLGYSLAPDMAEKVRNTVRQQKNKLLK